MSEPTKFIDRYALGFAEAEDINDFIDYWHDSDSIAELHDFLGLSWEEYTLLAADSYALPIIVKARMERVPIARAVNDNIRSYERIAARSDDAGKISALQRWIAAQPDR
ncbi:hypothetical protein [Sphingomonas sp. R86521]|uniref:hypothetical protein n=1 Tax=Sphingomonas sp. R86521 TaxID=3093860 RepID=UPI0036D392E9